MKLAKSALLSLIASTLTATFAAASEVETYIIDPSHSSVKFSIRHFVAKTTGNFADFEGTILVDRSDMTNSSVEATIQIPSIDTDSRTRDEHLQEEEYFDASSFPVITFKSTKWKATGAENIYVVKGDLSIRGITKTVTLDVELLGFGEGNGGNYLSGWEITTVLNRTDWDVSAGQPAVGDEVDVTINIEAIRE